MKINFACRSITIALCLWLAIIAVGCGKSKDEKKNTPEQLSAQSTNSTSEKAKLDNVSASANSNTYLVDSILNESCEGGNCSKYTKTVFTYNNKNKVIRVQSYIVNALGEIERESYATTYSYDSKDNLIEIKNTQRDGSINQIIKIETTGNFITKRTLSCVGSSGPNKFNTYCNDAGYFEKEYLDKENKTTKIESGNPTNNKTMQIKHFKYNEKGKLNLIWLETPEHNSIENSESSFTYEYSGNKEIVKNFIRDESNKFIENDSYTVNTYDEHNKILISEEIDTKTKEVYSRKNFFYKAI